MKCYRIRRDVLAGCETDDHTASTHDESVSAPTAQGAARIYVARRGLHLLSNIEGSTSDVLTAICKDEEGRIVAIRVTWAGD